MTEHDRLALTYAALSYDVIALPKSTVDERANFILSAVTNS